MCCALLAGTAGPKKLPFGHHRTTLLGYIFATKAHIGYRKKNLLNRNVSPICPHNMVNFGLLAAEICWRVWDTPANFNRFCILVALLHGTSSGHQPNVVALNRGHHLYSTGRPSHWALAHISSLPSLHHSSCFNQYSGLYLSLNRSFKALELLSEKFYMVLDEFVVDISVMMWLSVNYFQF